MPSYEYNKLPKTIEEATRRYIHNYDRNFNGSAADLIRLKNMTQAFIYRLRKIAPRFYEEKLPTFINQACSSLLLCEPNTREGAEKFHMTHGLFLQILDEFKRSQPEGDVDFLNEKKRLEEKQKLIDKQISMKKRIEELDAIEISNDEMGDDEDLDNNYMRFMTEKDNLERELKAISMEIALIEGHQLEIETNFELVVPARSILNRLTKEELSDLEKQMKEFCEANKSRIAMYVDISVIEGMFQKLNIAPERFQKEQIRHMMKDALDAYKAFFREADRNIRNKYYDQLLSSKHLLPREGVIIDPDDVPEEVRRRLEHNDRQGRQEFEEILETFSAKICNDKEIGDGLEDSGDEMVDDKARVIEKLKQKGIKFERVKEEPRDDCKIANYMMEEEFDVDEETAAMIVDNRIVAISNAEMDYAGETDEEQQQPRKVARLDDSGSEGAQNSDERSNSNDDDDDDGDIECLGTVEPHDKIKLYQLPE